MVQNGLNSLKDDLLIPYIQKFLSPLCLTALDYEYVWFPVFWNFNHLKSLDRRRNFRNYILRKASETKFYVYLSG